MIKWLKQVKKTRRTKKAVHALVKSSRKRIVARGKRIAVQYSIPYTHKFNKKAYRLIEFETTKRDADKIAREEREAGIPARVVPVKNGYAVYHKKSSSTCLRIDRRST